MAKRDREGGELPRLYEGQAVLEELLGIAGSPVTVEGVKALFVEAQRDGQPPAAVFPELFEGEPRFPSPEIARRLYGNLFGLWDRVGQGRLAEPGAAEAKPAPPPPVEPPQPLAGTELSDAFVDQGFRALTTMPPKELQRLRDRFEQRESELIEAIRLATVSPPAEEAAIDLAFELWAMCAWAFGERVGRTDFAALRLPTPRGSQPALDRYVAEWLGEAELDEEEPLTAEERQKLEPLLRTAADQLATPSGGR